MSYGVAAALQTAVYQELIADATLTGLVGSNIYDAIPAGSVPSLYVALGPEIARDQSDKSGSGAEHYFVVSIITETAGFAAVKEAASAVSDAMLSADMTLSRGTLISMNFHRARAFRAGSAGKRRIDLSFRARVQDD